MNPDSLRKIFKTSGLPTLILLPDNPKFTIAEANLALLKNINKKEEDIIGKGIFEAFPQNPNDQQANGVSNLLVSLQKIFKTAEPDKMQVQKYDMILENDRYEERFWQVENIPVLSESNEVQYIIHTTVDVTDSVLLQQKQQEIKKQNDLPDEVSKILINEGSDLIVIVDAEGICKYLSPSFEAILGYCRNDFIGKNGFDFIHPDDKEVISKEFSQLVQQKRVHASPCRFRDKNGSWHWIEAVLTNLLNDPQVNGIVAVSRDITEWMNAEEDRKISEEKYKLLFNYSPIPKWLYALDTLEILDVNEIALKNYGYSREEFLNLTIKEIRPKEDIKELIKSRKKFNDRKGIVHFGNFTHLKKDGTAIKVEISGNRFSFKGRDCLMVVCIDITEKENALLKLKDNEEKLIAAQNIAKVGYFKVDLKNHHIFWSDKLYEVWGVDKKNFKVTFQNFFSTIHADDAKQFEEVRTKAIKKGIEMDLEFRVIQVDGSVKWLNEKGKIIKDEQGNLISFEGTVQDVTESKLLKLSLQESNQRYNYVIKATFDAIWDWDLRSDHCYWGDGFQTTFGYDSKTRRNDKNFWTKHAHPEDRDQISADISKAINGSELNWLNEYRFQKADGSYAHVLDRCMIIRDNNGKAIRMVGAMQDISEKKMLQQLLHNANHLAKFGSWEIDAENNTVYWSDVMYEICEAPFDYKPSTDAIHRFKEGTGREKIIKAIRESMKTGKPWEEDIEICTEKGNLKWIKTVGKAEVANGKCVKVFGSFQDIDVSKKVEIERRLRMQQLKESEKRYSELFRLNPQPIWIFELETFHFVQVNNAAIDLYEYSEEEFLTMTIFDMRPKEEVPFLKRVLTSNENGGLISGRFRHQTKSRKILDVEVKSNFIWINNRQYRLAIITDVTEKNRIEHQITKAIIRTQENERYEIGAELHDNICQILATTHINLGVLSKSITPCGMDLFHQCREYIHLATQEIRNLSHRLAPAFFSDSTLEEAFEVLLNNCNVENKYNVTLYFDQAVEESNISRDLQLNLYRILQEQLRNILKYSHCKNIEIDLVVNKNKLKMRIADDGVGFDTNAAKGGIGLSNMRRRVELFYGKFKLYSSAGNGCEIVIDIPLKDENLNLIKNK